MIILTLNASTNMVLLIQGEHGFLSCGYEGVASDQASWV